MKFGEKSQISWANFAKYSIHETWLRWAQKSAVWMWCCPLKSIIPGVSRGMGVIGLSYGMGRVPTETGFCHPYHAECRRAHRGLLTKDSIQNRTPSFERY